MSGSLGIEKTVSGDYDDVVKKTIEALKSEGFGVLTTIDVTATLKERMNIDFTKYVILGACNPPLAYKALCASYDVGLFMPCNVIVYEKTPGEIVVSAMNPLGVAMVMPNIDLSEMANPAFEKLSAVIAKI